MQGPCLRAGFSAAPEPRLSSIFVIRLQFLAQEAAMCLSVVEKLAVDPVSRIGGTAMPQAKAAAHRIPRLIFSCGHQPVAAACGGEAPRHPGKRGNGKLIVEGSDGSRGVRGGSPVCRTCALFSLTYGNVLRLAAPDPCTLPSFFNQGMRGPRPHNASRRLVPQHKVFHQEKAFTRWQRGAMPAYCLILR